MNEGQAAQLKVPELRVSAVWTLGGLAAGLALGLVLRGTELLAAALRVAEPVGALWLRGLQMTILPLVASLLFVGIVRTVAAASAGALARRTLVWFAGVLLAGAIAAAVLMPTILAAVPIPPAAAGALAPAIAVRDAAPVPGLADFVTSLVPVNVIASAAENAMLPVIVFVALFALAATRLDPLHTRQLHLLFEAIAGAMMVVIGWVLALAPVGVFALSLGVAARSGVAAVGALAHYIVAVSAMGLLVAIVAYGVAMLAARLRLRDFARAALPAQAVAISTQSSLATLPAMLAACRSLGVRQETADFVLPLAVTLFRATGPAMNVAVAIYAATLAGVELTPQALAAGVVVSLLTTLGAPSLPGTISFVVSIAPIAVAMGAPLGPLALLVAVEMLPDIMRTAGNVTMDVAVAAAVDRKRAADAIS